MQRCSILVVYRKQLGDLLLLQPALSALENRYGGPICIKTREIFTDLLALMPGSVLLAKNGRVRCEQVYCFDTKPSTVADAILTWPAKRVLLNTRPESNPWQRMFFNQVLYSCGRNDYRAKTFHTAVGGHDFHPPRLKHPPSDWFPESLPEHYLVVHPTSAWHRKTWPSEHWIELIGEIFSHTALPIVLTSGNSPWEVEMTGAISSRFPANVINLGGKTTLRGYLAILSKAQAVLTIDSSASHLAAAYSRPVLTLFGPTSPVHWHFPTTSSRMLWARDFCNDNKPAVATIPVEAAWQATRELLAIVHA